MPVGEVFLGAFLSVLFDRLASSELLEFANREGLRSRIVDWEKELRMIRYYLQDAEKKQIENSALRTWLEDLRDLAYDVEDLLDEFDTEALQRKLMAEPQATTSKVQSLIPTCFPRLNPSIIWFKIQMSSKIKEIDDRLKKIFQQKNRFDLEKIEHQTSPEALQRPHTTSYVFDPRIYGREEEINRLVESILADNGRGEKVGVIPIVGMGGIGKTTLARHVFNHEKGSKIIVTTRIHDVALTMGPRRSHFLLNHLSDDDCWSVFKQHAFETMEEAYLPNLISIGKKIVEKCKGLPLAAESVGGLLRNKLNEGEWEDVLNSEIWDLSEERNNGIVPALRLSYYHLPAHLKPCFEYCSIFPKDYEFEEREVVLLWMAQGYISSKLGKQMEDIGSQYFRELWSRSFFQSSSAGGSLFVMHDLIHDLTLHIAGALHCNFEGGEKSEINKARHFSYISEECVGKKKFEALDEAKCLRTFLLSKKCDWMTTCIIHYVPMTLCLKLKCLRVLSLSGHEIFELPDGIGNLKHLRYLNLSKTYIREMPKSVSALCNLQTLILRDCLCFREFPKEMWKLINLRHLDTSGAIEIEGMPFRVGELTRLQTLSDFIVGKKYSGFAGLGELKNLLHLKRALCISRLRNVTNAEEAREASLVNKEGLSTLELQWNNDSESLDSSVEFDIMEALQPPKTLEGLTIEGYGGDGFPNWMNDAFSNMRVVRLENCQNCALLPSLGKLPVLKELTIIGMNAVKKVGSEFYWGQGSCSSSSCSSMAAFQSLETLNFEGMGEWEVWEGNAVMPQLRELIVTRCPKLERELPINKNISPLLEVVSVEECGQLVVSFSEGSFPSLREIYISGCDKMVITEKVCFSSLVSLTAYEVREVDACAQFFSSSVLGLAKLEKLRVNGEVYKKINMEQQQLHHHLNTLRSLEIEDAYELVSLEGGGQENQQGLPVPLSLHTLTSIERLSIFKCESIVSFPDTGFPPTLRDLCIHECAALRCIFQGEAERLRTNCLKYLQVVACPSLTCISSCGQLPPCLESFSIYDCPSLPCISSRGPLPSSLTNFHIQECKLEWVAGGGMAPHSSLRYFSIGRCPELKSLPDGLHALRFLQHIQLDGCRNLESLPQGGLPTTLTSLTIDGCEKLEELHSPIHHLTSLHYLNITSSPGIFSSLRAPDQRSNREYHISFFHTNLKALHLEGLSCEDLQLSLPTSLLDLGISNLPNLEKLSSKPFQNHNLSLQLLAIRSCPKLTSIPRHLLPPSLLSLKIFGCRLLKPKFAKGKGQLWPKIQHIPRVEMNGRSVFEREYYTDDSDD
ncbi:putative disease resistance RPP13-like protein 1 isoform X2 [Malania oleifera]|uniref:putative disease resistance RPP13-like protein 1 isoform X2 n=1 Tax=Malania oleifera TaxID=397392 RepID=UPI0025AE3227|nr:putative disease resistance RPP13-like protein 1 isoform X2 [Malania oleifera]